MAEIDVYPMAAKAGVAKAKPGDVVRFHPGRYEMQLTTKVGGVTFQGPVDGVARIVRPSNAKGNQVVAIKHDNITLEHLTIDGENRAGAAHGVIRFYSCKNATVRCCDILNSRGALLSIGGSVNHAVIRDVLIEGNVIRGSGAGDKYGEAIYIGRDGGGGMVGPVVIRGNVIGDFGDNGIDLKERTEDISIYTNLIENQTLKTKTGNHGVIVAQGSGHRIIDNYMRDLVGGSSIFNLKASAGIHANSNVIRRVKDTEYAVRYRASGKDTPTRVTHNYFEYTPTKIKKKSGLDVRENYGLDFPMDDFSTIVDDIKRRLRQYMQLSEPEPKRIEVQPGEIAVSENGFSLSEDKREAMAL